MTTYNIPSMRELQLQREAEEAQTYLYHIVRSCEKGVLTKGYIGISNDPARRFKEHCRKGNEHLQRAFSKYKDIEIYIISEGTKEAMLEMEAWLRPTKRVGWNIAPGGGNPPVGNMKGFKWSDDSKKRLSEAKKGSILSEEQKVKISNSLTGTKRSDEFKAKMSSIRKGAVMKGKPFRVIDPLGVIHEGSNLGQFCKENNLSPSAMSMVISGQRKQHKNWTI